MRVVGLLRGVNLGPSRTLRMADLRAAVESLGHTDVRTYLQSGNVVFTPAEGATGPLAAGITAAIAAATGLDVNVLTRTGAEMASVVAANPYRREDPTKVVVTFLAAAADAEPVTTLDLAPFAPEGLTVHGTEIYFDLPGGQARSALLDALGKRKVFGKVATSRNWRTVLALAEMSAD
jgi:uncharacterized protein (DUF1697 family)